MNHILPKPMDNNVLKELVAQHKRATVFKRTA